MPLAQPPNDSASGVQPLLMIDATGWSKGRAEAELMFAALDSTFLKPGGLRPIQLIITAEQYSWLPRAFDDHQEWLRVERIPRAQDAWDRVKAACGGRALIARSSPVLPWTLWLAVRWDAQRRTFTLEPPDALQCFARNGQLEPPPTPSHPLEDIAKE